jgi:DNA-binding MurR/RpiR family transcriptional regulator
MSHNEEPKPADAMPADVGSLVPDPDSLPRKQQQLAEILRNRPEVFAFGNLRTIEQLLDVSSITVIRFAKRLGFNGFQGLQAAVRDNYLNRVGFAPPAEPSVEPAAGEDLIAATIERQRKNLDAVHSVAREEEFHRVATTLLEARRVFAFGSGSAGVVARLLVRLLRHVGVHGELIEHAGVDQVIGMRDLTSHDVVVAVSLWLNFKEAAKALRFAKRRQASTIAIVGGHGSPLASLADQSLYAPGQGVALSFSLTAPVALVECIVAAVAAQRPERVAEIRRELHELYIEEDLIASMSGASEGKRGNSKR